MESAAVIYNWAQLTSEAMTNLFLYGDITTPENLVTDALLRPLDRELVIDIDAVSYMLSGPGRFIDPRNFAPISKFFSDAGRADLNAWFANNPSVSSKTFSLQELQSELGWSIKDFAGIQQADYVTDFADEVYRTYVWGSSAFELQNTQNLEFVVESAGGQLTLHVNGINIAPRNDNFDFQSSSFAAGISGQVSQSILDPSAIGRTVVFNYSPFLWRTE
jgi:hypothetical protein